MGQGPVMQQHAITPSCLGNVVNVKTKFLHQIWGPICTDLMTEMMISLWFYRQSQIRSSSLKKKINTQPATPNKMINTQVLGMYWIHNMTPGIVLLGKKTELQHWIETFHFQCVPHTLSSCQIHQPCCQIIHSTPWRINKLEIDQPLKGKKKSHTYKTG